MIPFISYYTVDKKVTAQIVKNKLEVRLDKSLVAKFPVEYVFDLLKAALSTRSKSPSIRRRALQLNGMSLKEALEKVQ